MQSQITESRRFKVDVYTVTFAADAKNSPDVLVFGIMTPHQAVPGFPLEKNWRNLAEAESYVRKVTIIAAEKLLAHYQENYRTMVEKINLAFTRPTTGFIAPDTNAGRYPARGRR